MFGPFLESWEWLKAHNMLISVKKPHLNFITIHYIYVISLTIIGSVLLYPAGNLKYIDALFFACGCATQSGLNTIDVNRVTTYQQVIFYFLAMISTPVFINTSVVFVRLYWFEKRFQHVAREARSMRSSRSRAQTEPKDNPNLGRVERGVAGRNIMVLHNGNTDHLDSKHSTNAEKSSGPDSDSLTRSSISQDELEGGLGDQPRDLPSQQALSLRQEVTSADDAESEEPFQSLFHGSPQRLPQRLGPEQHIAFLENQRNPKDKGTLRIPGPREFDRGDVPMPLSGDEDDGPLSRQITSPVELMGFSGGVPVKRNITIETPDHTQLRADSGTLSNLIHRRATNSNQTKAIAATEAMDEGGSPTGRLRAHSTTFGSLNDWGTKEKEPMPYLSWQPTIGRNSAFVDLTQEQREELGGIEYRSLKTLAIVLVSYYVLFHLLGVITLLPWIVRTDAWGSVADEVDQSRVWWGIFTPASMFNNLGYTLTPDSMMSFQEAVVPLLLGSFLIIIGNTGFPCMLRLIIWITSVLVPTNSGVWEELRFLLDHPRRCFTLLFPNKATWGLFWVLVILNGVDLVFYIILDLNDSPVTAINPGGYRVLNGMFQAASTRTAGFATVNLANLHPGIQVSYLVMMYISVFPIAISVRRTNVYEEKSLGIYGSPILDEEIEKEPSYIGAHLRRQLSFDLWYIFMGLFIVAVAEGRRLQNTKEGNYAFTLFSCLFEIVSAYGTVGLSLGFPNINASFSAEFSVVSKLVIIAMQIRGRHRGLPYELDRAILLPSESLHMKEDEDASKQLQRCSSSVSNAGTVGHALHRAPASGTWPAGSPTPAAAATLGTAPSAGRQAEYDPGDTSENTRPGQASQLMHLKGGPGKYMGEVAARPNLQARKSYISGE